MDKFKLFAFLFPLLTVIIVIFMLVIIILNSLPIFYREGLDFIINNVWRASEKNPEREWYGILAPIWGSLYLSILSTTMALPSSISIALFINEIAPRRIKSLLVALLDVMAILPTVVYGLWGMMFLAPMVRDYIAKPLSLLFNNIFTYSPSGQSVFTASLIVALMNIPYMAAIIREAYDAIPHTYREAIMSLGVTRTEAMKVLLGMVKPAILAALSLGFGRAIGETTAVTLTIGNVFKISFSPFDAGYSVTSLLANQFGNAYIYKYMAYALYGATLIMLIISVSFVLLGLYISSRWGMKHVFAH